MQQTSDLVESTTTLAVLAGRIDLDQDAGARRPFRDLGDDRLPIHRFPDRHPRRDLSDLVRLESPDEVHVDTEFVDHVGLGQQVLRIVLAHRAQPAGRRGADRRPVEALRHGQNPDGVIERTLDRGDLPSELSGALGNGDGIHDHGSQNDGVDESNDRLPERRLSLLLVLLEERRDVEIVLVVDVVLESYHTLKPTLKRILKPNLKRHP